MNEVGEGGCTSFPMASWNENVLRDPVAVQAVVGNTEPNILMGKGVGVKVKPRAGTAVLFYPSAYSYDEKGTVSAVLEKKALHQAEPAVDVKYVSQVWIRTGEYHGVPTRALDVKI